LIRLLRFQQSGGFAGLSRGCELSMASLPETAAHTIEQLIAAAHLDKLKPIVGAGADRHQYDIRLEYADDKILEVSFDDSALTAPISALVTLLRAHSKPLPLK
jgi:hypothetical protein